MGSVTRVATRSWWGPELSTTLIRRNVALIVAMPLLLTREALAVVRSIIEHLTHIGATSDARGWLLDDGRTEASFRSRSC
jgi:hypothetical protein